MFTNKEDNWNPFFIHTSIPNPRSGVNNWISNLYLQCINNDWKRKVTPKSNESKVTFTYNNCKRTVILKLCKPADKILQYCVYISLFFNCCLNFSWNLRIVQDTVIHISYSWSIPPKLPFLYQLVEHQILFVNLTKIGLLIQLSQRTILGTNLLYAKLIFWVWIKRMLKVFIDLMVMLDYW